MFGFVVSFIGPAFTSDVSEVGSRQVCPDSRNITIIVVSGKSLRILMARTASGFCKLFQELEKSGSSRVLGYLGFSGGTGSGTGSLVEG